MDNRTENINVRVSRAEKSELCARAGARGLSLSGYLRELSLEPARGNLPPGGLRRIFDAVGDLGEEVFTLPQEEVLVRFFIIRQMILKTALLSGEKDVRSWLAQ